MQVGGVTGFQNSISIIEGGCDIYASSEFNVTPAKVRSLRIEDLEETRISPNLLISKIPFEATPTNPFSPSQKAKAFMLLMEMEQQQIHGY